MLSAYILLSTLFISCTKDVLKSYEDRIGTWELYDVDKRGFGGNSANLPFQHGIYIGSGGGRAYKNASGTLC